MKSWISTYGHIDFDEPATLWVLDTAWRSGPWHSEELSLSEAVREALATDPDLHPSLRVTSRSFREPLDFEHIRALHGHPDYPSGAPAQALSPAPRVDAHQSRIVVEVQLTDALAPAQA